MGSSMKTCIELIGMRHAGKSQRHLRDQLKATSHKPFPSQLYPVHVSISEHFSFF